ncbi:MAG TPA: GDSL-type esterase/lipase family protein, partial [Arachidicoccus soli]|nr:GDSL-type esterase/lipase family protein [Arachidicoccus soli]
MKKLSKNMVNNILRPKTRLVLLSFFLLSSIISSAQNNATTPLDDYKNPDFIHVLDTAIQSKYLFIHFNENHYEFLSANSPNFEHLFFKISQLVRYKGSKLNFYQIGGSHIQADIYTGVVRSYLQNYWQDLPGARGLVFPFELAGSNNPWNYIFSSKNKWTGYRSVLEQPDSVDYGLEGDAIACSDNYITLKFEYRDKTKGQNITHIRLYHNKGNLPYRFYYQIDKGIVLNQKTNTEEGYTDTYFSKPIHTFVLHFVKKKAEAIKDIKYKSLFIYGLYLDNNLPGISFSGIGSNGASLETYIHNPNFIQQLSDFPPDFFAIAIGTNDGNVPAADFRPEEYKAKMDTLIQLVLKSNPNCAILLTVPNDAYFENKIPNVNMAKERKALMELAVQHDIPIWDLYGIMGGLGSSETWYKNG